MADIAINPVTRRVQFTGNTGTGPFAFGFNILQNTDIAVYKNTTLLTLTSDYTVSINANGTGSVTLDAGQALVATDVLTIVGGRELSRTTDFVTAGDLLASSLNTDLDSLTVMAQQLDERIGRAIRQNPGDEDGDMTLPIKSNRLNKFLKFDANGNPGVQSSLEITGAIIGANYVADNFTGDGSDTTFTLSTEPGSKNNMQVYIDGVYQQKNSYSLSETTLTFSEAPPNNASIEVVIGAAIQSSDNASAFNFTQPYSAASVRTVQSKLEDIISVKDFGAVGDGLTDDTAAIQAAIDAADTHQLVVGVAGDDYRITSTLNFNGVRFDGNYCTITKDFDGVGIDITGSALYTYLYNFNINASTAQTASDYDAAATSHGIKVNGTRVEAYNVGSSGHKGAGWWLECNGNMNKSKYLRIVGNTNSRAGVYMSGTQDDMSVWEFNGRFQSNKGYGMYITDTCTARNMVMWFYAEANQTGASFPAGEYAVYFGKLRASDVWAYVEQQAGTGLEFKLDTNCSGLKVHSVRNNTDLMLAENSAYVQGNRFMDKDINRAGTPLSVVGQLSRVNRDGEYVRLDVLGNSGGTGDSRFGYLEGVGNSSGSPFVKLLSQDGTKSIGVNNASGLLSRSQIANTTIDDTLITGRGHFIRAGSGNIPDSSTVDIDLIENSANFYFGKVTCVVTGSGAAAGDVTFYEVDFTYNGTTLSTSASGLNAAATEFSAALSLVGAKIRLSVSYTTGLGTVGRYSYRVDVVGRDK